MKPIYEPKGKAKEYGDYALNIYSSCSNRCYYCYCPNVLHKSREQFYDHVYPRTGIVEATMQQLEREKIAGKLIHLCFIGDPFPTGKDPSTTLEIIRLLKEHGNHVQILTKGDARPAIPLLDGDDWFGVSISSMGDTAEKAEPGAAYAECRMWELIDAKKAGINTWVSFEPVICAEDVLETIRVYHNYIDKVKIGKLNYHPSDIDWAKFGHEVEALCKDLGLEYYIKESLRAEMEKSNPTQEQ